MYFLFPIAVSLCTCRRSNEEYCICQPMLGLWLNITTHKMILLPYRFCGDSHHAFAFPFVLIFLPLRLSCKESSTSNQAFSIVFTTPSVPLVGDRNLRRKDVTALLGARNRYAIRLAGHQSPRQVVRDGTALL